MAPLASHQTAKPIAFFGKTAHTCGVSQEKTCPLCGTAYGGGEIFCPLDGGRLTGLAESSTLSDPKDPHVGATLDGRYRVVRRIGEGGMGIVYEAIHVKLDKRVALKILRDSFSDRPEVVERFRQEARGASRIGSEHIVDISDFGETPDGSSYFVMEFLLGEDLANVLARQRVVQLSEAADIIMQCCKALAAAHAKGIVHRDMKPENIFLIEREGRKNFVKVVDFGIAKMSDVETAGAPGRKLTKTGMIFGTPEYMSPEQAGGKNLDHRVDVYALGVILYEMLTGRVPFVGDTFMGILTQHMFEMPPDPLSLAPDLVLSPNLRDFIAKALAKDPGERFADCDEMAEALQAALANPGNPRSGTAIGFLTPAALPSEPRAKLPALGANEQGRRVVATMEETLGTVSAPSPNTRGRLMLAGAGFAAIGVAILAWVASQSPTVTNPSSGGSSGNASVQNGHVPPALPPVAPNTNGAVVADAALEAAAPNNVTIRVDSHPHGARVWVVGERDVCQETPCSFEWARGQTLRLRARRGGFEGQTNVTTDADQDIDIRLGRTQSEATEDNGASIGPLKQMPRLDQFRPRTR